ncbi:hypothetical protein [Cohnella luojiensis]|uniref:Uncharacterized protein n=1 Tax=Cohnella luojiensis TaxID=652876 RepID=A0A4Y8M5Z3_9BACL|nr:hypothetical protein [Cohnella luojiensis]TFE29960.1 hypothetical protein E2980_04175 [Cohnella luojiensis]
MKEDGDSSSVWSRYVAAKQTAFGPPKESGEPLTLEELEAAIAQTAASSGLPEIGLPPRAVVHPVKRSQVSRWFYLFLVVLFSSLVVGLVWWGREHYSS